MKYDTYNIAVDLKKYVIQKDYKNGILYAIDKAKWQESEQAVIYEAFYSKEPKRTHILDCVLLIYDDKLNSYVLSEKIVEINKNDLMLEILKPHPKF